MPQVVFGGWNGKRGLSDVYVLDTSTWTWSKPSVTGSGPSERNNHATFVLGDKMYVHGGHDGTQWLSCMYSLDTTKWCWDVPSVSGTPPSARACHTLSVVRNKVFCFGGFDGTQCFNDVIVLDLDTWTYMQPRVSGVLPQARNAQTATVVDDSIYVFGGHSGQKHLRDLHVLDTRTMSWSQPRVSGLLPPGLRGHTANLVGTNILIFAGYDGRGRSNDLYKLDTASHVFSHIPPCESTPAGRQRHTSCLVGSKSIAVTGGFDGHRWLPLADVTVLDVAKLEATAITSAAVSSLLGDLRSLLDNEDMFPDVTFLVGGKKVHGHRAILAARSPHFAAMFSSGMRESREKEVPIEEWSHGAFLGLLEFLYTGSLAELSPEVAVELMGLADHSGVDGLKALCEAKLVHALDTGNVAALFSTAHRYGALELKKHCLAFILSNTKDVSKHLDALQSEPALLMEITKESLASKGR